MKKVIWLFLALTMLCGCSNVFGTGDSTFTPDYPTLSPTEPEGDEAILAYRRDVVEQAMREQAAILWTPAKTFTYSRRNNSKGIVLDEQESPGDVSTFYAGRIYQGIPYTRGGGNYDTFLSFATEKDEDGVYTMTGFTDQLLSGNPQSMPNGRSRVGNDCADQLFWAWARISPTIKFSYTGKMTSAYGCLKVGDYQCDVPSFSKDMNTRMVVEENGEQRMFAAYALMQKGDGMVLINKNGDGHAVMVVTSNPVYLSDGTIDGEKSYVTVLEQTGGKEEKQEPYFNEEIGKKVYPCEIMDKEWSYNTLFKSAYLPVTCKELIDPSPLPEAQVYDNTDTPTLDNMFAGLIGANYRISSVTVTICRDGSPVQQATCFSCQDEMYEFNLCRFTSATEQEVMLGTIDRDSLTPGAYSCTFTAKLSTGEDIVFRDFQFTK